jgi:hypothetical protein
MNVFKSYKLANIQYKSYLRWVVTFVFIIFLIISNYNKVLAGTGINAQIPYSGTIVKNDGTVLADGGYRVKFSLYNVVSGGTSIYEEIRDGSTTYSGIVSPLLSIVDGRFEILLGSQNTTLSSINDDSLWVELQLDADGNGSYEEIFSPRKRIGSAMSAINSMRLVANGGTSTNSFSLNSGGEGVFLGNNPVLSIRNTSNNAGAFNIRNIDNTNILSLFTNNSADSFIQSIFGLSFNTSFGQQYTFSTSGVNRFTISNTAVTSSLLGGVANTTTPSGFDRVLLANSSGQFSQVSLSSVGSGWSLTGNATIDAWNGTSGSRLGTTSAQPLVLATTNATAQDIRFFTGANGANERMRILGNGNIGIGTTTPQARLDVNGGIRVGNDTTNCTSSNVGTLRYNNGGLQVCTASGWSYLQCPTGYIQVPGSSLYGTRDFCVMKYEAKTGSSTVAATTQAAGPPLGSLNQTNAITSCNLAGGSLINNREWMTIARNIEAQRVNWTGGTVGSGALWSGHTDNSPALLLSASTDDNPYFGTNDISPSAQRRTHTLSNGEVIWDLSGNSWEWTSDTILGQDKPNNSSGTFWQQWTAITNFGTLSYDLTRPSNTSWNSSQNMGQYQAGTVTGTTAFGFLRGGNANAASNSGIFALATLNTPSFTAGDLTFRCVLR